MEADCKDADYYILFVFFDIRSNFGIEDFYVSRYDDEFSVHISCYAFKYQEFI